MNRRVYVDFSNVFAEARHLAAVQMGMVRDVYQAQEERVGADWQCDFDGLLQFVADGKASTAVLVTSTPFPPQPRAEAAGFECAVMPRGFRKREKCVDTYFAVRAVTDALLHFKDTEDEIILVTGDLDQLPTIRFLQGRGFRVTLVFWAHASYELVNAVDAFYELNPFWDTVTYTRGAS